MAAVSGNLSPVTLSCIDDADLAGKAIGSLLTGDLAYVASHAGTAEGPFYFLDITNTDPVDGTGVLATSSSEGRWLSLALYGSIGNIGALVFATVADLAAFDDSALNDGATAYVQSVRSIWQRRVQLTHAATDDITSVQGGSNTATWYRSTEASPSWLNQAAWYIDGVDGSDEGTGGANDPLLTHDEFMRRIGQNKFVRGMTVTFVQDAPGGFNFLHATLPGQHNGFQIVYGGEGLSVLTPVYTETFSGFQAISRAGNGARTEFTSVLAKATWDTYVGKIVLVTDAADPGVIGAYAWVCATSQADDTVVYTTPFTLLTPDNVDPTPVDPSNGDTYVVVDPTAIQITKFQVSTEETLFRDDAPVVFQNIDLSISRDAAVTSGGASFFSSTVTGIGARGPAYASFFGCHLLDVFHTGNGATLSASACFIDGTSDSTSLRADDSSALLSVTDDSVIVGNATLYAAGGGQVALSNLGAFNTDTYVVILGSGTQAEIEGYIYGDNNPDSFFQLGFAARVISLSATLLAATTAPNVSFGGAVTQNWAGLPFIANAAVTDSQAAWLSE